MVGRRRRLWLPPTRLRSAETEREERHATWFELFFDLVFVVAVGQLSSMLAADASAGGFVRFVALFVPVWWAWVVYVTYADRFDTDDPFYRVLVMLGMLAAVAMAVSLPRALDAAWAAAAPFAVAYVGVRLVPLGLYVRAGASVAVGRELAWAYATVTLPAAGLWLAGLAVPLPWRYAVWALAATLELANPFLRRRVVARTPVAVSHLAERFGGFTIIVLGEAVLSVGTTLGATTWQLATALLAGAAFCVVAAQWWLYFDFMDAQPLRRGFIRREAFIYGHLPLVVGITALAAGTKIALAEAAGGATALGVGAVWAICGGAASYEVSTGLIHAARHTWRDWLVWERGLAAALLLGLGVLGPHLAPLGLFGALVAIHLGQVVAEVLWHAEV